MFCTASESVDQIWYTYTLLVSPIRGSLTSQTLLSTAPIAFSIGTTLSIPHHQYWKQLVQWNRKGLTCKTTTIMLKMKWFVIQVWLTCYAQQLLGLQAFSYTGTSNVNSDRHTLKSIGSLGHAPTVLCNGLEMIKTADMAVAQSCTFYVASYKHWLAFWYGNNSIATVWQDPAEASSLIMQNGCIVAYNTILQHCKYTSNYGCVKKYLYMHQGQEWLSEVKHSTLHNKKENITSSRFYF